MHLRSISARQVGAPEGLFMKPNAEFHLCIVQPAGYVHSLGLLDPARYLRWQLRRLGLDATLAKNRLREDAINIVFGAHLGFDPALRDRHACVFFNLEQTGAGGAALSAAYLKLLRGSAVVDYDADNVAAYCEAPDDVPVLPILHAPYLADAQGLPLQERPIDLLFFGSMNPRRRAFIERVEACGVTVSLFDQAIYGSERDAFIRQAKAVLNCHFYESSRFEQVRVAHCLSLGTPVISERGSATLPGPAFEACVTWLDGNRWEAFFRNEFARPSFYAAAARQLDAFARHDPLAAYADFVGFCRGYLEGRARGGAAGEWRPRQLNIGSGKDYRPGWLNVDVLERTEPDLVLDLAAPRQFPIVATTRFGAALRLEAGSLERICASNVLEHVPDLPQLMGNALELLAEGGEFEIEVPYEKALTAWQDPTHLRALNENSWIYYTQWFWYLGWFEHRFEMSASTWLNAQLQPCAKDSAAFMRVLLRKVSTTAQERNLARTMRADFGGVDDPHPALAALSGTHAPRECAALA
jgi:SAM-dependent methyltransferase